MRAKIFYRMLMLASVGLVGAAGGCAPDAATDNVRWQEDPFSPAVVMNGRPADAAVGAMRGPGAGAATRPLVASEAPRWSDVPMAIRNVAGESFLGVDRIDADDRTCVARTVQADGQDGTVTVRRRDDGSLECTARLSFAPPAADDRFVAELRRELRRLAAIKRPQ
jgi:hypothetical protein